MTGDPALSRMRTTGAPDSMSSYDASVSTDLGQPEHVLTFVAASTPVSISTNLRSSGFTSSLTLTSVQFLPANLGSGFLIGGLSIMSCTASWDREDCLDDLGEGGRPRSSWKLWRCCAAALGMEETRREGVLLLADGESMLVREDIAVEGGELTGGSRLGVDIFAGRYQSRTFFLLGFAGSDGNCGVSGVLRNSIGCGEGFVTCKQTTSGVTWYEVLLCR